MIVYGLNPVLEVLRAGRVRAIRLSAVSAKTAEVRRYAEHAGILVTQVSRQSLDTATGGAAHQGVLADVEPWTPYQLRHAALERIEQTYGRTGAMRVAGHQAAATTDHYVRVQRANEQQAATIAEAIG